VNEGKRKEVIQLVKVSIEVHSGAVRFGVAVQAKSIQQALSIVAAHHPGSVARVKSPIEPEGLFVEDAAA
jgi:hypothetical protein